MPTAQALARRDVQAGIGHLRRADLIAADQDVRARVPERNERPFTPAEGLRPGDDPLAYGVDGLRTTLIGVSHFGLLMEAGVLVLGATALLMLGSRLFDRIQV